ncbi:MAG TPA: hypothetical protein VF040_10675 [Ktedonobacterales bacterium]
MNDWKAELDTFFRQREQQDQQQQLNGAQPSREETAIEEFMVEVATAAFQEFGAALQEHGRRIRLRLGDSHMRIITEFAGTEEFDYTLWAGMNGLSAESRTGGRHTPDRFQNAKGNSNIADTTKDDVVKHLVDRYIALTSRVSV